MNISVVPVAPRDQGRECLADALGLIDMWEPGRTRQTNETGEWRGKMGSDIDSGLVEVLVGVFC